VSWFRRHILDPDPTPPALVKGAEFHPSIRDTIIQLGGAWYCGTYGAMYKRQPAVRAVVDFLARNVAQLNAKVYERLSNTDRIEVPDHPLAELLRYPNPETTRYRHMRDTVSDLAIYDVAYWRKMRANRRLFVVRVSPEWLNVQIDPATHRRTYRTPDGTVIPRDQLVVFPGYSPDSADEGVSPLETLRRVLLEADSGQQNRENMWRNSARQSGWIQRPLEAPEWSDTGRQRFRADIESTLAGGSNAGRIGVLEDGMVWNPASFSPKDTEYVAGRRLTYEEVAIVYGIDPSLLGQGQATKASAEQKHQELYQDTLGPLLRQLQDEIELRLLPEFEPLGTSTTYVEFNIAEKLKGSFEEQATVLTTSVGVPVMTPNEGRARLNLPRIDGDEWDMPIMPLNVVYGGQPAVTVPTADPGTPAVAEPLGLPAPKAVPPSRGTKAAPRAAVARLDDAIQEHADLFRRYFTRQERAVKSAKAVITDRDRWNRELGADLYVQATKTAKESGHLAALQQRGVYDEARTLAFLSENARIAAESINAHTFELVHRAVGAEEVANVFEVARGSRTDQLALGRASCLINFARTEAGKQSEQADGVPRMKTWVVTSPRSRHPEMNGQSVPVSENFSNGMAWPGDGRGHVDQVAGCHCLLSLDKAAEPQPTRAQRALAEVAARFGVSVDEVKAARGTLKTLRRRVADEAARDQYEALGILERSEAVKVRRPSRGGSGDYDWLERVGRGERARLSRAWYTDSVEGSVDQIADNLRRDLGGELVNMSDDAIMSDVWLPLNRRVEGAGAIRRGKLPSDRAYGGRIDPNQFAPGVNGDGYDVAKLLGDEIEAAGHVAQVNAAGYADEAYRALGNATTAQHGPAPFEMSFQAWETEVRTIEEGLDGAGVMPMPARDARARLAELIPADLDGPGMSYEDVYASIVTTARQAALDVPERAVIPWAD
jgi:HK97 family phage portal protein